MADTNLEEKKNPKYKPPSKQKKRRNFYKSTLVGGKKKFFDWTITDSLYSTKNSPYVHSSVYTFEHAAQTLGIEKELGSVEKRIRAQLDKVINELEANTQYAKSIKLEEVLLSEHSGQAERFDSMKNAIKGSVSRTLDKLYRKNNMMVSEKGQLQFGGGEKKLSTYMKRLDEHFKKNLGGKVSFDQELVKESLAMSLQGKANLSKGGKITFKDNQKTDQNYLDVMDAVQRTILENLRLTTSSEMKELFPKNMEETIGMQTILQAFLDEYASVFHSFTKVTAFKDGKISHDVDPTTMNGLKKVCDLMYTDYFDQWSNETMRKITSEMFSGSGNLKEITALTDADRAVKTLPNGTKNYAIYVGGANSGFNTSDIGYNIAGKQIGTTIKQMLSTDFEKGYAFKYDTLLQYMDQNILNQINYFLFNYEKLRTSDAPGDRKLQSPEESATLLEMYNRIKKAISIISVGNSVIGAVYFDQSKDITDTSKARGYAPILLQMTDGYYYTCDMLKQIRANLDNNEVGDYAWEMFYASKKHDFSMTALHNAKLEILNKDHTDPAFGSGQDGRRELKSRLGAGVMPSLPEKSYNMTVRMDLTKFRAAKA